MAAQRVPVPHVERDLAPLGLAMPIPGSRPLAYMVTPRGQQMIDDAMKHNAGLPPEPPDYRRNAAREEA